MQSKKMSLLESFTNIMIGYWVAVGSQLVIFPLMGYPMPLHHNLIIELYFTVISLIRSYILRRYFNKLTFKRS